MSTNTPPEEGFNLLNRLGAAAFTPEGSDTPLMPKRYRDLMRKAEERGLDTTGVEDRFTSLAEVSSALPSGASQMRQKVSERIQLEELEEEKRLRDESIKLAQSALDDFTQDNSYENLLANIRNLPATLSDEDVQTLKRVSVQRARADEVQRLKRVGATVGVRGFEGGGAFAALAEQAARSVDDQISRAFNQIAIERLEKDRSDLIESTMMEAEVLQRRQQARMQLEQNLRAAREGFFTTTQPLQDYSAFIEAVKARELAAELERDRQRNELIGAGISAGGSIAGGVLDLF